MRKKFILLIVVVSVLLMIGANNWQETIKKDNDRKVRNAIINAFHIGRLYEKQSGTFNESTISWLNKPYNELKYTDLSLESYEDAQKCAMAARNSRTVASKSDEISNMIVCYDFVYNYTRSNK